MFKTRTFSFWNKENINKRNQFCQYQVDNKSEAMKNTFVLNKERIHYAVELKSEPYPKNISKKLKKQRPSVYKR